MKVKTLSILGGAAAMMIAGVATADNFTGLSTELHTTNDGNDIYRLYANFSGAGGVQYWGGEPGILDFSINNITADGGVGSGFHHDPAFFGIMVLNASQFSSFPQAAFSTFMTIGADMGYSSGDVSEVFQLTPGFDPVVDGQTSFGGSGGIVSNPGGANTVADENGQVLLAQFAVAAGEHVEGTIGISTLSTALGDTGNLDHIVSFTTIPDPGALALLGLAGLVGTRRRRA